MQVVKEQVGYELRRSSGQPSEAPWRTQEQHAVPVRLVAADTVGKQFLEANWVFKDEIALQSCVRPLGGVALSGCT